MAQDSLSVLESRDSRSTFTSDNDNLGENSDPNDLYMALTTTRQQLKLAHQQLKLLQQNCAELKQRETKVRYQAFHDGLTGLPNRSLLEDRFAQAASQAERHHKPMALLLLDLDEFKHINDNLGHTYGDKLLMAVAKRLNLSVRGIDTVCRYGGDEFVILLQALHNPIGIPVLLSELRKNLAKPYVIEGYTIRVTASIGVAIYPMDGRTYMELIERADHAMYRDKKSTRNVSIEVFTGREDEDTPIP
ncbi:MAG: GGDEF domain-containing protein [Gammaproteobacteria bacterium]|nr:GGDEF domain-containing protein [Gammaproteobacteria bacterium]